MGRSRDSGRGVRQQVVGGSRLRQQIAQAAARIMAEDQAVTHRAACDKAVKALGGSVRRQDLPDAQEIDQQLIAYQSLFQPDARRAWLRQQRRAALDAMDYFKDFSPRLTGAVLRGASTASSPAVLHLFADSDDEVALKLINLGIGYGLVERRYRWPDGREQSLPVYQLEAGGQALELVVFARRDLANPPLSPLTGSGVERADRRAVEALLEAD